jgi:preprotein translocase subunit YajC
MHLILTLLQAQPAPQGPAAFMQPLFLVAIIAVFYFFMIRPQQKRAKEEKKFREALAKGDRVMLQSGIYGTVSSIEDAAIIIKVDENTRLKVNKSFVFPVPPEAAGTV